MLRDVTRKRLARPDILFPILRGQHTDMFLETIFNWNSEILLVLPTLFGSFKCNIHLRYKETASLRTWVTPMARFWVCTVFTWMSLFSILPIAGKEPSSFWCWMIQSLAAVSSFGSMKINPRDCAKDLRTKAVSLWTRIYHRYGENAVRIVYQQGANNILPKDKFEKSCWGNTKYC